MTAVNTLSASIGRNLRRYRTLRGLSGQELAQRSGIARATLSALEAGRANPTLDTLVAVAGVIGIDVVELMECRPQAMTIERAADALRADSDDAATRLLRRFRGGPCSIDLYALALSQDEVRASAAHSPGVLEHILIQAGKLELELDPHAARPRRAVLHVGDYVSFTADVPHVYTSVDGDLRATLIMHYAAGSEAPAPVEVVDGSEANGTVAGAPASTVAS